MKITLILGLLASLQIMAGELRQTINMEANTLKIATTQMQGNTFNKMNVEGFEMQKVVGKPELPVKSFLLKGIPENIQVQLQVQQQTILKKTKPMPVQPQDCRCVTDKKNLFVFNNEFYSQAIEPYTLEYIGSFRGQPITRLDVSMAEYQAEQNQVLMKTKVQVVANASEFSFERGDYRDYLILVPQQFEAGLADFVTWKKAQGLNVLVETLQANLTLDSVATLIKNHYKNSGMDFVLIIGDSTQVPMKNVATSGSSSTPSDLYYYTMDGADDTVPDMFYGRISTTSAQQLKEQLAKSIEFEKRSFQNAAGMKRIVGIASNEGSNPSDDQYVKGIEKTFTDAMDVTALHLFQNDSANSNPTVLNKNLNEGAFWLTYLGHGSGTSWPSFNRTYSVSNIKELANKDAVKPIIIDVACMNGRIGQSYLGSSFLNTAGNAFGAAAYYGGTVNISWHPPAVMAQGIASEHMTKKFKFLGEALLAGQLYLSAKWNKKADVVDNFEWYHLQGDPSLNVQF